MDTDKTLDFVELAIAYYNACEAHNASYQDREPIPWRDLSVWERDAQIEGVKAFLAKLYGK